MIKKIKTEIKISPELEKRIKIAKSFSNLKGETILGSMIRLLPTNIAYVEPHKFLVNNTMFLFFNESKYFFINDLNTKKDLCDLEMYLKMAKAN